MLRKHVENRLDPKCRSQDTDIELNAVFKAVFRNHHYFNTEDAT
jgi:hypothetical protein